MSSRPRRAAAAANPFAPQQIPSLDEDPLVADDADEVDENGDPIDEVPELDRRPER